MRPLAFSLLITCLLCAALRAEDPPAKLGTDPEAHLAKLDAHIDQIDFDGVTAEQAIALLADKTRANIVVDWRSLEAVGFDRKLTTHVRLADTTLKAALKILCAAYSPGDVALDFTAKSGVIRLGVHDGNLNPDNMITRIYEVRDFEERFVGPNPKVDAAGGPAAPGPGLFDSAGSSADASANVHRLTRQELIDALTFTIEEYVDAPSWRDNGGQIGSIKELGGLLIVTQTPENQRRVQLVLHNLRKLRDSIDRGDKPTTRPIDLLREP